MILPFETEERAKKTVQSFMRRSIEYTTPYFERFAKIQADYLLSRSSARSSSRSDLRPPYSFIVIESFVPELVDAFFGDKPYVNVIAKHPIAYDFERPVEDFLTYEYGEMGIIPKFTVAAKNFTLYGTCIVATPWRKTVKTLDKGDGEKFPAKIYDLPDWSNVNIFDFFPDPGATLPGDIDSMRGVVHRVWITLEDLKKNKKRTLRSGKEVGHYFNLDKLEAHVKERDDEASNNYSGSSSSDNRFYERSASDYGASYGTMNVRTKGKICILQYYGEYDVDGNGNYQEYCIAMAEGDILIRFGENKFLGQYKPFLAATDYPLQGEFYGAGEIEPNWSSIQEAKALRIARLDAVNLAINPPFLVERSGGFNLRNLYVGPGRLWVGNNINAIKPLDTPEKFLSAYRETDTIDLMIQQGTAMPNAASPARLEGYGRTAEGVRSVNQVTNSRLILKIRMLASQLMERFSHRMMLQNSQFLAEETWFRVAGNITNPFRAIPVEAFWHQYIFSTQTAIDRLTKKARQMNLKENVIPLLELNEKFNPQAFKWNEFVQDTLTDFDYHQAHRYFREPQETQQLQQQAMQQQMMMADQNAKSQAQAQMAVVDLKGKYDLTEKQHTNETMLKKTVVKGVMENERADTQSEHKMTQVVGSHLLKGVIDDTRDEATRAHERSQKSGPTGTGQ